MHSDAYEILGLSETRTLYYVESTKGRECCEHIEDIVRMMRTPQNQKGNIIDGRAGAIKEGFS